MLVLASGSEVRAEMLRNAGLEFDIDPARVDEGAIREVMLDEVAPVRDIADALAEAKARQVAVRRPDDLVIGADQVLVCEGQLFEKPGDLDQAAEQLRFLRGKTHELLSAVVIYEEAAPVWRNIGRVRLSMRNFSDAFLADYVAQQGDDLLTTVGAYKLEGAGAQLFAHVEGDYFSVLGLPLLAVLDFLRSRNIGLT